MEKTNLQRKASYYDRVIKEAKESKHSELYKGVCVALEPLVALSNELKDPGRKMTTEQYESLLANYNAALLKCKEYMDKKEEFTSFEKDRMNIIQELGSVLYKDMKALRACDPLQPGSLSEVMEKSRTYTVEIKRSDIKKVGNVLSSRIPLKIEGGKKGFFSPKKVFNQDKKWEEQILKHEETLGSFSEKCRKRLDMLKTNDTMQQCIGQWCPDPGSPKYNETTDMCLANVAFFLGMADNLDKAEELLEQNVKVYNQLYDFAMDIAYVAREENIMQRAGIAKNADITSRNCALTDVARLLGCGNLVANSTPMKVLIDGEEVEGVFMEAAEGSDIGSIKEDDLILKARANAFDNPQVYEQLADLQVLDFICGNVDRHQGNMIYQFQKGKGSKITLAGIKGIDNDCSFGTPEIKDKKIMHMVNPEDMRFISRRMANVLESITKEMIQTELMNSQLSEKEIDAVWNRLEQVREALRLEKIEVKDINEWGDYKLSKDNVKNENYFNYMQTVQSLCDDRDFEAEKGKNEIHYAKGKQNDPLVMVSKLSEITKLKEMMEKSKALVYNSSEYNAMKKRFEKIETLTKEMKEKYTDKKLEVPVELANDLKDAYVDLIEKTDKYVELKKLVPSTERGKQRIAFATKLLEFANDTVKEMAVSPEREAKQNEAPLFKEDDPMVMM